MKKGIFMDEEKARAMLLGRRASTPTSPSLLGSPPGLGAPPQPTGLVAVKSNPIARKSSGPPPPVAVPTPPPPPPIAKVTKSTNHALEQLLNV
jgi:hypothetical protein